MRTVIASVLLALPSVTLAGWMVDNDSSMVSFVSTKAGTVAEVHTFHRLTGGIDASGDARIAIALDSVDTAIEVRDGRMRELLFDTANYPEATVRLHIDPETLADLEPGMPESLAVEAELALHGTTRTVTLDVTVALLDGARLLVASRKPVIVDATQVGLADGVEKLREVAGLASISPAVPVSFLLVFDQG